jgi:hypothetical protein
MNQMMRFMACALAIASLILEPSSFLRADGGSVRLSEQQGKYRITVFTAPTPVRAGPVDVSVLVQEAATGELAPGVRVMIKLERPESAGWTLQYPATTEAATNKLFHAATFDLPEPGCYLVEVQIDGDLGEAQVRFELSADEGSPQWPSMWACVGWPVVAILLFGVHQRLVRRRSR